MMILYNIIYKYDDDLDLDDLLYYTTTTHLIPS